MSDAHSEKTIGPPMSLYHNDGQRSIPRASIDLAGPSGQAAPGVVRTNPMGRSAIRGQGKSKANRRRQPRVQSYGGGEKNKKSTFAVEERKLARGAPPCRHTRCAVAALEHESCQPRTLTERHPEEQR